MAASLIAEELEPQAERDLAPQLAVASPASEPPAQAPQLEEPASLASAPTGADTDLTTESRHEAIARAAYFLAEARGFEPGHELDDWLSAERQISSH
jgi:hypothetical protein